MEFSESELLFSRPEVSLLHPDLLFPQLQPETAVGNLFDSKINKSEQIVSNQQERAKLIAGGQT